MKQTEARKPRHRVIRWAAVSLIAASLIVGLVYYERDPGPGAPDVLVAIDRSLWNSVGLNRFTYVRHLRRQGLSPVLVEYPDDLSALADLWTDDVAGLVLTGGGDVAAERYGGDPDVTRAVKTARDAFELALLDAADRKGLPILGLCRGAQLMNVWRGGTLGDHRHDDERFGVHKNALTGHTVIIEPGSRLHAIYGKRVIGNVTTWHGQFVDEPGVGVTVTGVAPDGTPEAIELEGETFRIGVQWHAEMPPWDETNDRLFESYADAVRQASTK